MLSLQKLVNIYNRELGYNNLSLHLYRIEVIDNKQFINQMRKNNIVCGIHYSALHLNPVYNNDKGFDCSKSEKLEKSVVSLPMNENLSDEEVNFVIKKARELI